MQKGRHRPGLRDTLQRKLAGFLGQRSSFVVGRIHQHIDGEFQSGKVLAQAVMKFTRDAPAFLILQSNETSTQSPDSLFGAAPPGHIESNDADLSNAAAVL